MTTECTFYTHYCYALSTYAICIIMFTFVVIVQDEMNLMKEEHEKELQELKVDISV